MFLIRYNLITFYDIYLINIIDKMSPKVIKRKNVKYNKEKLGCYDYVVIVSNLKYTHIHLRI